MSDKPVVPKEVVDFLQSNDGKEWFRSQTPDFKFTQQRSRFKSWIMNPPGNIKKWVAWVARVRAEIERRARDE